MDTNKFLLGEEVYRVVGVALEVLRQLGHGLHEKPYENAMVVEFGLQGIPFAQQQRFPVIYKGVQVSEFIPDLIAYGELVIDTKVIEKITDHEKGQMLNYLRITGCQVGLIINFKHAKLEWQRIILSDSSRSSASIRG